MANLMLGSHDIIQVAVIVDKFERIPICVCATQAMVNQAVRGIDPDTYEVEWYCPTNPKQHKDLVLRALT